MSDADEKRTRQISLMVPPAQLEKFFASREPAKTDPAHGGEAA